MGGKFSAKMASSLAGVELSAGNVEQAVLQFYQSRATQVCAILVGYQLRKHLDRLGRG